MCRLEHRHIKARWINLFFSEFEILNFAINLSLPCVGFLKLEWLFGMHAWFIFNQRLDGFPNLVHWPAETFRFNEYWIFLVKNSRTYRFLRPEGHLHS